MVLRPDLPLNVPMDSDFYVSGRSTDFPTARLHNEHNERNESIDNRKGTEPLHS